jgi:hypothetical protein
MKIQGCVWGHFEGPPKGCPKPSSDMGCHVSIALLSWPLKEILKRNHKVGLSQFLLDCPPLPNVDIPRNLWKNGWKAHHIPI